MLCLLVQQPLKHNFLQVADSRSGQDLAISIDLLKDSPPRNLASGPYAITVEELNYINAVSNWRVFGAWHALWLGLPASIDLSSQTAAVAPPVVAVGRPPGALSCTVPAGASRPSHTLVHCTTFRPFGHQASALPAPTAACLTCACRTSSHQHAPAALQP